MTHVMRRKPPPESRFSPSQADRRSGFPWAAWFTHLYTTSGAVLAFLSIHAIVAGDLRQAFFWLAVSTVIDASDGLLARRFRVSDRLPEISGSRLDDIVDYLTFVFVPAFLLYEAGRLPEGWGFAVAGAVLVSSAIAFSRSDAKTADHFFTGFPSYWNIVALYLYAFDASPAVNALVLLVLCALVFVRIGYVYPSRTPTLRLLTLSLGALWGLAVLAIIWQLPDVNRPLLLVSLGFPVYYTVLSLVLHARRS